MHSTLAPAPSFLGELGGMLECSTSHQIFLNRPLIPKNEEAALARQAASCGFMALVVG